MLIVERSIFGVCLALVAYVYVGYPIFVWVLSWFVPHEIPREEYLPYISLIIPAHNEERRIRQKLENTLKLDYPQDRLEIIVASDSSTDRTAHTAPDAAPPKIPRPA